MITKALTLTNNQKTKQLNNQKGKNMAYLKISPAFIDVVTKMQGTTDGADIYDAIFELNLEGDYPFNYIDLASQQRGKISYLVPQREERMKEAGNFDFYGAINLRTQSKAGAFFKKLFPELPDNEVTQWSEVWAKYTSSTEGYKYEEVKGEQIRHWYSEAQYPTYEGGDSSLHVSCMRGSGAQKYLSLYVNNPDKCRMAILTDSHSKLVARALLWEGIAGEESVFYDRIYSTCYELERIFSNELQSRGLMDLRRQYSDYEISLNIRGLQYFPYMDSFKHGDGDGTFSIENTGGEREREYRCTGGGYSELRNTETCEDCGEEIDTDNDSYIQYRGGFYCSSCYSYSEHHGRNLPDNLTVQSDCMNSRILEERSVQLACGDYCHEDYVHSCYDGECRHQDDCSEIEAGEHERERAPNDELITDSKGREILDEHAITTESGEIWPDTEEGETYIELEGVYFTLVGSLFYLNSEGEQIARP